MEFKKENLPEFVKEALVNVYNQYAPRFRVTRRGIIKHKDADCTGFRAQLQAMNAFNQDVLEREGVEQWLRQNNMIKYWRGWKGFQRDPFPLIGNGTKNAYCMGKQLYQERHNI